MGEFYQHKKSVFYEKANFLSVQEVIDLLKDTGFDSFSYYQTIFDFPDNINVIETPKKGFDQGGFVVISALKSNDLSI